MSLSIVIPCLNEVETLQKCIEKIKNNIKKNKIKGEIIVSDNGSTDGSLEIAKKNNVKVVNVKEKGYGNVVRAGIKASTSEYIFIADADDSYDFNEIPRFYNKIKNGYDIIQGCRLLSGGGKIEKGAMPLSHKYIGNPFFTFISRIIYKLPFNDVYCGMKIIKKTFFDKVEFFSGGMVFCLEILIKSIINNAKTSELPITLHKDGRIKGKSHLKTIKDGLLTLKFILICSPKWIYIFPSLFILILLISHIIFISSYDDLAYHLNKNLIIYLALILLVSQILMLGLYSTLRAETLGLLKKNKLKTFFKYFTLKLSIILNILIIIVNHYIYHFKIISLLDSYNDDVLLIMVDLISLNLIFNSFFVSLLRLNK